MPDTLAALADALQLADVAELLDHGKDRAELDLQIFGEQRDVTPADVARTLAEIARTLGLDADAVAREAMQAMGSRAVGEVTSASATARPCESRNGYATDTPKHSRPLR